MTQLRGPSFPGTLTLTTTPGQPLLLPAFLQPSIHFLEGIRLDVDTNLSIPANPATVTINVLNELLVGNVTSRPLSLDEIRALGIQFDATSFQAFMFTVAFTTESGVVTLNVPVLVPVGTGSAGPVLVGSQIPGLNFQHLPDLGLPNLSIEPIMLEVIGELTPEEQAKVPPITGILVIPGNIAFLNSSSASC